MATIMKSHQVPSHPLLSNKTQVQKVCTVLGIAFIVVGILGLMMPGFMGLHLSFAHNLIHLTSGAFALWSGQSTNSSRAYYFSLGFGTLYVLLGILGFVIGEPGYPSVGHMEANQYLLIVIPNVLEFGSSDHVLHFFIGTIFLFSAYRWKKMNKKSTSGIAVNVQRKADLEDFPREKDSHIHESTIIPKRPEDVKTDYERRL